MKILDRYASAVHASSLKSEERTTWADVDVIGAAGLAAKSEPIGVALARMLSGGGAGEVINLLSIYCYARGEKMRLKVSHVQARDIATAVLAWYRHGTCQPCGGTGFARITDTPSLGNECQYCNGSGKIPFDKQFRQEWQGLARWLANEIDRSQAQAGHIAMKKLAPMLDL